MEDWYQQQEYFSTERYNRIQAWMQQEVVDLFAYNIETAKPSFAVG